MIHHPNETAQKNVSTCQLTRITLWVWRSPHPAYWKTVQKQWFLNTDHRRADRWRCLVTDTPEESTSFNWTSFSNYYLFFLYRIFTHLFTSSSEMGLKEEVWACCNEICSWNIQHWLPWSWNISVFKYLPVCRTLIFLFLFFLIPQLLKMPINHWAGNRELSITLPALRFSLL